MHESLRWVLRPGCSFVIAVGFSPKYRKLLVRLAKAYTRKPEIAFSGEHQPYMPIYAGVAHGHKILLGSTLDVILKEFASADFGTLPPDRYYVYEPDESVYYGLVVGPDMKKHRRVLASLLAQHAEEVDPQVPFSAMVRLGTIFQENEQIIKGASIKSRDTTPTNIIVGYINEQSQFRRLSWVAAGKKEVVRSAEWKKEMKDFALDLRKQDT